MTINSCWRSSSSCNNNNSNSNSNNNNEASGVSSYSK